MSVISNINLFNNLPKAYNGCTCSCHRTPGVKHIMPCCGMSNFSIEPKEFKENLFNDINKDFIENNNIKEK